MTSFMKEFEHLKIQLEEIKRATNSFCNKVIGAGGFGAVYQGEVSHSRGRSIVAIKRLNRKFGQGDPEFLKEIVFLSRYTHPNLISLLGFCDEEDEKVLVYEFASKGSLDRHLSDPELTWVQRIKICLGAAKGLNYLHDPKGRQQRVLHCDIKSANILLDERLTAKVADFGLSKIGPANQQYSVLVTNALGTPGYCDPLFMTMYTLTKESDVYSFGVVLFEVLCGRLCYEYSNGRQVKLLVNMWKEKFSENKLNEIVFQDLETQMDRTSLELFSNIAFQCLHDSREGRPTMSIVVKKLKKALKSQVLYDQRQNLRAYKEILSAEVYKEILNAAEPPLRFTSIDDLDELLSNGVFLNAGKTWFSRNANGEHYVMISLAECLIRTGYDTPRYSADYDSRFEVGCYSTGGWKFKTCVKTQLLSPLVTYRVNLVFKFTRSDQSYKHEYLRLKYRLNIKKKVSIVHLANKIEDEWLKASLYQFTGHERTHYLEIDFDQHYHGDGLQIEAIEFQPLEKVEVELHQVLELKYGEILKAATHPLILRSEAELNALLSKGVLINDGKMWFSRNDKGVHYVFKSIQECLIPTAGVSYVYTSEYNSSFPVGSYNVFRRRFKACVKTEFLSPLVTYTVNLVFKFRDEYTDNAKQGLIWLPYKLDGETHNQVSHFAYHREDGWWTVELYHFISDGTTVDLEIIFEGSFYSVVVDGIEFQPLEKWFCLDKNGKTCLMLPAREVCRLKSTPNKWKSLPESRFGEGLVTSSSDRCKCIVIKENKLRVLSHQTKYACYLVYKTERGECTSPLLVRHKDLGSSDQWEYGSHIYLVGPQTPVIRPKAGENTHNPLHRPKLKGIPQQRSDGWMEVRVWEFQTDTTMTVIPSLLLEYQSKYHEEYLKGLTIMGIEFRPI